MGWFFYFRCESSVLPDVVVTLRFCRMCETSSAHRLMLCSFMLHFWRAPYTEDVLEGDTFRFAIKIPLWKRSRHILCLKKVTYYGYNTFKEYVKFWIRNYKCKTKLKCNIMYIYIKCN